MAQAKMETAAERFRRIKAQKEAATPVDDVSCECGMVWKGRRVPIDFWVSSGILPARLAEAMMDASQKAGGKPEAMMKTMAAKEIAQSIEFSAKVVRTTAVEPKIVETVTDPLIEVGFDEVMTCCFKTLLNWQMQGGDEAAGLGNFPQE